jgi:hypothetical protein
MRSKSASPSQGQPIVRHQAANIPDQQRTGNPLFVQNNLMRFTDPRSQLRNYGLILGVTYGPVAHFCDKVNEHSVSIEGVIYIFDHLNNCWYVKILTF